MGKLNKDMTSQNELDQVSKDKEKVQKLNRKKWEDSEDAKLSHFVNVFGTQWLLIAEKIGGRSANQCSQRWKRLKKHYESDLGIIKKRWTQMEDQKLLELYTIHGPDWKKISKQIPNKDRRSVRNRFVNTLDPNLTHGQMSEEEDILICQLYSQYGSKWSLISKHLSGRPENMIKNRFNSYLKLKYFQLPNLYYVKNSKNLRKWKKEQKILSLKRDDNFDEQQEISMRIDGPLSYNFQSMNNNQDSCIFEVQESNFNFQKIF